MQALSFALEKEEQRWFLWTPVFYAAGVLLYFSLHTEPPWGLTFALMATGVALVMLGARTIAVLAFTGAVFWFTLGFTLAKVRTHAVATPTIKFQQRAELTGWVEQVVNRREGGLRVTILIHNIQSFGKRKSKTPKRIRLTMRQKNIAVKTGQAIKLKAVLMPPPEPVWPGGFDYAQKLWFQQIGAVGYAISPPETLQNLENNAPLFTRLTALITRFRERTGEVITSALPGRAGALAKALITGDRSSVSEQDLEALRGAGLAHILAISGLHMTIMAGALYWLLRSILAAFPLIALHWPIKKIAAACALMGGAFYLLTSGAALSTQRAFIMTSVILIAIILNRSALTLRNVALAALIILLLRPESILDVGFQMSFAAASALVAIYEMLTDSREKKQDEGQILPEPAIFPINYISGIATTTIIASLAVAPLAAYHFHQISQFSLLGNILAMPVVGILIMPMALLFFITWPLGLHQLPLYAMEWGLDILIWISTLVSSLPGAVRPISQIPSVSLGFIVLGCLWLIVWKTRWRYAGLLAVALGLALSPTFILPDILVDKEGKIIAIKQNNGGLSAPKQRAGQFSLKRWMKIYGETRELSEVQNSKSIRCDAQACTTSVKETTISYIRHPAAIAKDCRHTTILITPLPVPRSCQKPKLIIDKNKLKKEGAHAIFIKNGSIHTKTVAQYRKHRIWAKK